MYEKEIAFCNEKVGQEGSSLYYALLFQPPRDKAFWLGCFAMAYEIKRAAVKQMDSGLAQVKLGWWRNALLEARAKTPQHPIILAIGPEVITALPDEHWAKLINETVKGTEVQRHPTDLHSMQAMRQGVRLWVQVLASKFGWKGTDTVEALEQFMCRSLQLTQLLRLAKYADDGFIPLPVDWLAAHGVPADHFKQRVHGAESQALFTEAGEFYIREANNHWARTPAALRLACRPLRALFRMRVAEFHMHQQSGMHLLSEQKELNPWKKLSTSWTTQVLRR